MPMSNSEARKRQQPAPHHDAAVVALIEQARADALAPVLAWFSAVENIHNAYANIVMDTPEERALHAQLVSVADVVLAKAKAAAGVES